MTAANILCPGCGRFVPLAGKDRWECNDCKTVIATGEADIKDVASPRMPLIIEIGTRGNLRRQVMQESVTGVARMLKQVGPTIPAMLSIGGYDFDPREIPDIPEARDYLIDWVIRMEEAEGITPQRFLEETQTLILCCLFKAIGREDLVGSPRVMTVEELQRQIDDYRKGKH